MSEHLSDSVLNALADGELLPAQLAAANDHIADCASCTSQALYRSLLKSGTAKAGERYAPPPQMQERLMGMAARENTERRETDFDTKGSSLRSTPRLWMMGWATAVMFLLVCAGVLSVQRNLYHSEMISAEHAALVDEVFDQHVAMLAGGLPPQVLSTDRHTVKPWFQGKIPFSFNLPDKLPKDTTLDGANLSYLSDQPVAQLLYRIGKHRISVFIRKKIRDGATNDFAADHSGFHVMDFSTDDLEMVAVSDLDPARLAELTTLIRQAQAGPSNQRQ